ncbi:protein phosphatase 2C domain-containing protein [Salinarimonas ramus]|uniref:Protein phosphatase 2C n=1 Tax=Salinarimonas ramus TaxID=690164 RepID=A0A917V2B5_9HYPH|nr:protein phosphatase 2C domain-containing protein [Salinarimonas ramus]GGK26903.1 hypothetical protein GCM10011322_11720 [Salinarimonas ramus]
MAFTIRDQISLPGSPARPNEDACGAAGDFAWVIDGAILPGTEPIMDAPSDAAWLAGFASARFAALAPHAQDPAQLTLAVIEEARAGFLERVETSGRSERMERHTWPVAALTLAHRRIGRLDTLTIADTIAYVRDEAGAVYTLGEAPDLRRAESALAARLMRETGADVETMRTTQAYREDSERRRRAQVASAPAVFGLHPDAVALAERGSVTLDGDALVLLASDGFSALVELYEDMDVAAMMARAAEEGLSSLAARLREIETRIDPSGHLYPRFKRSDDATAILVEGSF